MSLKSFNKPWSLEVEELNQYLKSDLNKGLSSAEAAARLTSSGENIFTQPAERGPIRIFSQQFYSPLIIILCVAAILTAILGKWVDTGIILFAVLINAALGFIQEYRAEKALASLQSYITERTRVVRDGKEMEINPNEIVLGDILHIKNGARITADARIIKEIDFTADEAVLTGESLPVEKTALPLDEKIDLPDRTNMIFAGTLGVDGSCYAIVTATGNKTEIGKIAHLVTVTKPEKTPLQKAIGKLTRVIVVVALIAVTGIFYIGISNDQPVYEMLLLSIAVLVGSVPETLPVGLTAVLAIGVERIAKRKGIIRNLTASETLGSTTLVITDKTGTLTQGIMRLVDIDNTAQLLASNFTPTDSHKHFEKEQLEILTLARCAADVTVENPNDPPKDWSIGGSVLDINIARAAGLNGIVQSATERTGIHTRIPFSSKHKFSVVKIPSHYLPGALAQYENPHVVMGAPEILLELAYLDEAINDHLKKSIMAHSNLGRRVLGLALYTPQSDQPITPQDVINISFLGVLSFVDPVRPRVKRALEQIQNYGTEVVMATGDLPGTALAIARDLGWEVSESNCITGQHIRDLSDSELSKLLPQLKIFARVTPEDKLRVTRLYQARGEIVAMTGDGVNDAPALKAANIGIAVGSGSDVAKSVADLVLLDNNFETIVATIEEGRQILANLKKVFSYLMSNVLDELLLVGGAIIAGVALPLSAVQIIWVNLFTGSLPAIAFAFDTQDMNETKKTTGKLFDIRVIFLTTIVGVTTSALLLAQYLVMLSQGIEVALARSILFACFGSYVLIIAFSFRDLSRPIWRYSLTENRYLLGGVLIGLFFLILTIYLPFFQELFAVATLPLSWVPFVIGWLVLNVAIVEVSKWFANRFLVGHTSDLS